LDIPYTISSDGKENIIELSAYEVSTSYQYESIPKLEEVAYLNAEITDWYKYNLLSGSVNLYFENTDIGKSEININTLSDTLTLSLGRDENVQIQRERNLVFQKQSFTGNKKKESREYLITVRNNKAERLKISLQDQIPISTNKDVEIQEVAYSEEVTLDENSGSLIWDISLNPQEERTFFIRYSVKYPKTTYVFVE